MLKHTVFYFDKQGFMSLENFFLFKSLHTEGVLLKKN